jgi:hypothetical protein
MPAAVEYPASSSGRLLLISNRLPITIKRSEDGEYSFSMSSGGLVTGLSGLSKTTSFQWYGWPGLEVPEAEAGPMREQLKEKHNAIPVFVDDELADRHYNGFASTSRSSVPCLCDEFSWLTAVFHPRLDPLAPLPLPPRRDHFRRVRVGCIPRSEPPVCSDRGQGRAGR